MREETRNTQMSVREELVEFNVTSSKQWNSETLAKSGNAMTSKDPLVEHRGQDFSRLCEAYMGQESRKSGWDSTWRANWFILFSPETNNLVNQLHCNKN